MQLRRWGLCSHPLAENLLLIYFLFTLLLAANCVIFRLAGTLPNTCPGKLALDITENCVILGPRETEVHLDRFADTAAATSG